MLCAAGKYKNLLSEYDWARSCGAARNTGCAAAQSSGAAGEASAVWTPQTCTQTSNEGANWWSVTLGETAVIVTGLRVRGRAQGTDGYSVYIGDDTTAAGMLTKNTLCVAGVAGETVEQFAPVDLVCARAIPGRIAVFVAADSHLTLCDVEIWSPECAPCLANSDSLAGSDERTDCQCKAGFTRADGVACSACLAGTYGQANFGYNRARSCGAARNASCPTAQSSTADNGLAQRAVDGNADAAWDASSCSQTFNTGVSWWSVTLGTDPVLVSGLRVRANSDGFVWADSKGYSVYVGNDLTPAGMFTNNAVCVPAVAGRGLTQTSADDLMCGLPISGRHVIFTVTNARLILCEVEIWSPECIPCPANTGSLAGSSSCVCSAGWTWSDAGQCVPCEAATYKATLGPEACLRCPDNADSPAMSTTNTACECNAGWNGAHGGVCETCVPGKYTTDSLSCVDCEPGKYSTTVNAVSCVDCPPDTGSVGIGATRCGCFPGFTGPLCEACVGDTYKDFNGDEACTACPASSSIVSANNTAVGDCACSTNTFRVPVPD